MDATGRKIGLVLTRKIGERIFINDDVIVELVSIKSRDTARIRIQAPSDHKIMREEIYEKDGS